MQAGHGEVTLTEGGSPVLIPFHNPNMSFGLYLLCGIILLGCKDGKIVLPGIISKAVPKCFLGHIQLVLCTL